jgi:hypothetical protein
MAEPMRDGLARTLAVAEGSGLTMAASVPLLFAIDGELGIEGGYAWDERDIQQLRAVQLDHGGGPAWHGGSHGGGCATGDGGGGGCGGGGCGGGG